MDIATVWESKSAPALPSATVAGSYHFIDSSHVLTGFALQRLPAEFLDGSRLPDQDSSVIAFSRDI